MPKSVKKKLINKKIIIDIFSFVRVTQEFLLVIFETKMNNIVILGIMRKNTNKFHAILKHCYYNISFAI